MTCKECIHYDVCEALESNGISKIYPSQCGCYKPKSRFIELPCEIGQTVYVLWAYTKARKKQVYPATVYALRYDQKKNNMRVCVKGEFKMESYGGWYTHYYQGTFTWENVGKTVFLTKEEAEKALEERNKK
ncbi:MAG: hypothetical protein IJN75_04240 [Clostridia bacterium]|nr:hypothetical protein [Clostridia bacterium]